MLTPLSRIPCPTEVTTMQAALRRTTNVQSGGRIEITDSQLPEGKSVDVIVLFQPMTTGEGVSILDVLAQAPGHLAFKTAEEVDAYLQQERQEWER
jgi:hypothetical protein